MSTRALKVSVVFIGLIIAMSLSGCGEKDRPTSPVEESKTYLGVSSSNIGTFTCGTCHQEKHAGWSLTRHANAFQSLAALGETGTPDCLACHTTGYDTSIENNGYDDRPPEEKPLLANVQCEDCHGPGSLHNGRKDYIVGFPSPFSTCGSCHILDDEALGIQPQYTQWLNSEHSTSETAAGGFAATDPGCRVCHTSQGFIEWLGRSIPATTQPYPIACMACHDEHDGANPRQLRLFGFFVLPDGESIPAGKAAVCAKCHNTEIMDPYQAAFDGDIPRNSHADMFANRGGVEYGLDFSEKSFHAEAGFILPGDTEANLCVTCHMATNPLLGQPGHNYVGDHSFAMDWDGGTPGNPSDDVDNIAACTPCHATLTTFNRTAYDDYDGDTVVEGIRDEVSELLNLLQVAIVTGSGGNITYDPLNREFTVQPAATVAEKRAVYNWYFVDKDGSLGVHNAAYTVRLLQKTYENLTGSPVPGAVLR